MYLPNVPNLLRDKTAKITMISKQMTFRNIIHVSWPTSLHEFYEESIANNK
jgi:hypothetical protein